MRDQDKQPPQIGRSSQPNFVIQQAVLKQLDSTLKKQTSKTFLFLKGFGEVILYASALAGFMKTVTDLYGKILSS